MIIDRPEHNKLAGVYRGQVIQHLTHGKCKVWIPGIYPDEFITKPDNLPPAEQASSLFGGINNGNGMFSYPNIGAIVWCFFENGDQNRPVYFAASLGGINAASQFRNCNQFESNDDGAYLHKICCGRSTITFSEVGNIIIENRTFDVNTNEPCDTMITLDQSGNVQINSTKSVTVQSDQIEIRSGQSIQMYTKEMKIKATDRCQIISPYIGIETKNDVTRDGKNTSISEANQNGVYMHSDSISLDASAGCINTMSQVNGPASL